MKKLLFALLLFTKLSSAQINLPEWSPESRIHQPVGYATIEIRYGRPAARERKVMGELVPYKKLWRTCAGKCTTISFNQDVIINNKTIAAGIYSIATIPDEKEWTVMLNADTSKIYGDPSEYDIRTEVLRFKVNAEKSSRYYETLTIDLDIARGDAIFFLSWENTQIHFSIKTGSNERALSEISKSLEKNPNNIDALLMAAWYYYMNNENLAQALEWLNHALSLEENGWAYSQKIDILERLKNYEEARKTTNNAINFLKRKKPYDGWERTVLAYETRMKNWPSK